ncbi:MAG: CapA family protein, partial [Chloroflexota bacterium]
MTLLLAGDTNLQFRDDPAGAFRHVLPLFRGADVRFVNLEGPLAGPSEDPTAPDIPHKAGWRHSEPRMVAGLVGAGIDAVGCANNVTYP